jgi:cell division protein FtsI/penicillin-binding protein 2
MALISPPTRGNLKPNKLMELAFHVFANQYEPDSNPNGIVALAVAENKANAPRDL